MVARKDGSGEHMDNTQNNTTALILAGLIVISSAIRILFPQFEMKEIVETFFGRQMEFLSAMGAGISTEGIPAAVLSAFSSDDKGDV